MTSLSTYAVVAEAVLKSLDEGSARTEGGQVGIADAGHEPASFAQLGVVASRDAGRKVAGERSLTARDGGESEEGESETEGHRAAGSCAEPHCGSVSAGLGKIRPDTPGRLELGDEGRARKGQRGARRQSDEQQEQSRTIEAAPRSD